MTISTSESRQRKETKLLLLNERRRRRASTSLHEFVAQAWHIIEPGTEFVDNWHVGAISEHLEAVHYGEIRRLLINVPPRFLKSTIVSVCYPAWTWIHQPWQKFLTGSYAAKLAIRDNLKMRRLIQSRWYRERWGRGFNLTDDSDWGLPTVVDQNQWGDPKGFELTGDQNQKIRFENNRGGYRIAFGFEGGVMGEGGDKIIIDDAHDRASAHSDTQRGTDITTYREAISTRVNDPLKSAIVIIGQRLHEDDISGYVIADGGFDHVLIPMHYDSARAKTTSIGWRDPRRVDGELLHPERFSAVAVAEWEKTLGSYAAAGQLEQNPAPAEGGILKIAWWRFYNDDQNLPMLPTKFDTEAQSWDMAFKGNSDSNFTAGQAWGRLGANCYKLPDEVYAQLDFPAALAAFKAFTRRHPHGPKWVEDKANGPAIISMLKGEIAGIIETNDGGSIGVAESVAPYVEAGNVWLPNPYNVPADKDGRIPKGASVRTDGNHWRTIQFISNAAKFPNGSLPAGSHGDDVVAATQAIFHLLTKKKEGNLV
jgi:hypothetical protein